MPHEASDDAPFCPNAEPAESPRAPKPHERRAFSATLEEPAAPTITPILAEFGPFFPRIVVKSARFTSEIAARNAPDSENDVPEPTLPFRACTLVPAFDAEASLRDVVEELRRVIPEAASGRRLVVIDDGSRDGTGRLAHELGCTVVAHGENRGKGAALRSGLATARAMGFQVALSVDADGQHPATSAREVLYASRDPEALVLGVRDLVTAGAPKKNRMSNRISNFFLSFFSGKVLADTQCGLRRYPVVSTLALAGRAPGYAYESELLLRAVHASMPMVETTVPVIYPPEELRVTHFDSVRDPARIIVAVVSTLHDLRSRKTP